MTRRFFYEMPDLGEEAFKVECGRMRLFKGGGSAPAPDPLIGQAALKNAELGEEALDWYQSTYANYLRPRQDAIDVQNQKVIDQQMRIADSNEKRAEASYADYNETYKPVEKQMVEDATGYDSAARVAEQRGIASTDVTNAFANTRAQNNRSMAMMGVNPNSARFATSNLNSSNAEALAKAGAVTKTGRDVTDRAIALRAGVSNFGRGMQNTASNAYGVALSGGSGAAGIGMQNNAAAQSAAGTVGQGFGTAMQGYSNQANILNTQYQNQLNAWQANQASKNDLLGSVAGAVGTYYGMTSSKKAKTDKEPINVEKVADDLKTMPVEKWSYKKGIADEGQHVGAYAEDFAKRFGGDGKTIDMISAHGVNMAATQGVMKKLERLEKKVSQIAKG